MLISIIIPVYNEKKLINATIDELLGMRDEEFSFEFIFSNDGSTDGCENIVASRAASDDAIKLVGYEVNRGKGAAIREGVASSSGDVVVYTDCDLAYGVDQIKAIIKDHLEKGADVTVGSRRIHPRGYEGYSFARKIISRAYLKIVTVCAGCKVSDSQSGLKCFGGEVGRKVFSLCEIDRFAFDLEFIKIAEMAGCKINEFPVRVERSDKELGRESKINFFKDSSRMLKDIFRMKKRIKKLDLSEL
ncbi:MAG: glycosyltransferase [Clostridia bacterium]|nr:glycosyltransferase [Clostridia bacterium]